MSITHTYRQTGILACILCSVVLLAVFYAIPYVFGFKFIDGDITPIYTGEKMTGIKFVAINDYFLPVSLSYNGADVVVDIFDKYGNKVHRASFLKDALHDDEEGYKHMARLPAGSNSFYLYFNESSQYYRNNSMPSLEPKEYTMIVNAFGKEIH